MMTLQSMTGFARDEEHYQSSHWVWEIRSVNGKSLDLRFRLPPGFEVLEPDFRALLMKKLKRGNVQINLQMDDDGRGPVSVLNEQAFDAALKIATRAAQISCLPMPGLESLLSIKGVVDQADIADDPEFIEARNARIMASFARAVDAVARARTSEGAAIAAVLLEQVSQIDALTAVIKHDKARSTRVIQLRLQEQLARLLEQTDGLDPQRLHQEAAILATKSDLQEELDRLEAHIASARQLLTSAESVGRKLEFLAQEFNRECNTICSKSNAASVTHAGLEMKVVIDQFREQVQNIQ